MFVDRHVAAPSLPPAPHDPRERCRLSDHGPWSVRVFAWNDRRHRYLAGKGMLHLQLWNAYHSVSVLSPSQLTFQNWEVWIAGERHRSPDLEVLNDILYDHDVEPICSGFYQHFYERMVLLASIGACPRSRS